MDRRQLARIGMIAILAVGSLAAAAQTATHTTLSAETHEVDGKTVTTFAASVVDENGTPVNGAVTLSDRGRTVAGAALDAQGGAEIKLDGMSAGEHTLRAVFAGDAAHQTSASEAVQVHSDAVGVPDFALAISASTLDISAPGGSGDIKATVTPINGFTGFISLSCSGNSVTSGAPGGTSLPVGVACVFNPANLQLTSANPLTADMTLNTASGSQNSQNHPDQLRNSGNPLVLAVLLPGALGIGLVARKRKLFGKATLLVILGGICLVGTTSCAARYNYLHHGPTFTGTQPGTYTITVTAQTSNGVTAASHSQTFALTVK